MKSLRQTYAILFVIACCLSMWVYYWYSTAIHEQGGVIYYLKPGTSKNTFISDLKTLGIIRFPIFFEIYTYSQKSSQLKTGEYLFTKGTSLSSIWHQVRSGTGLFYRPFTIVPGWSFKQLRHELLQTVGLRHQTAKMDDKQIMQYMGNTLIGPEGEFYPETYYYTRGIADLVILKRAFNLMQTKLSGAWQERKNNLPYKTAYEALIAASLIEKESFLDFERPMIASVLVNRLKKDMLLQFDPTVIYGLGERYDGKIHKSNLLDNNVYNTYLHKGLPPTPIAMPSYASIAAAMHPHESRYLYFVAKGDGSHQFSETLLEHNVAVVGRQVTKPTPEVNAKMIDHYMHSLTNGTFTNITPH